MPGRNRKGFAAYALLLGMVVLSAGLLTACHHNAKPDDFTQPPSLPEGYAFPVMLATVGQPFTSVTPPVTAYYYDNGVGSYETLGFSYSVSSGLPGGLALNASTGVISGTPTVVSATTTYYVSVSNVRHDGGGVLTYPVTLGVQATSPVTLTYDGLGAVSTAVGANMTLGAPTLNVIDEVQVVATGFAVSPALPAGLSLDPATGVVSGAATVANDPATVFTVTATSAQGSADASFTLLVTPTVPVAPAGLAYATGSEGSPLSLTVGVAYTGTAPTVTAGTDMVYTVVPALPAGLSIAPLTGIISGTPTTATSLASYAVTASNAGGSTTPAEVYLVVEDATPAP